MQALTDAIICANNLRSRADDIQDAIIALSNNSVAADVLTWELRNAVANCENFWRDIELRDDFKEKYGTDRQKAIEDCCNGFFV